MNKNKRKSIRLKNYDYSSAGEYFVTICTYDRKCLFGEIAGEEMRLSSIGSIVQEEWLRTPILRSGVSLDAYVIMPNHIHGIVVLQEDDQNKKSFVGTHSCASLQRQPRSLGSIIAGFKSAATKRINETRKMLQFPVWQNRFYEHIIRNEKDLNNIRDYIMNNPLQWKFDEENPNTTSDTIL